MVSEDRAMTVCRGCGGPMPPKQRPSRNDRVWCSRACYRGRPSLPSTKQQRHAARHSEERKVANRAHEIAYRNRYPERQRAREAVKVAVRQGRLIKVACFCGETKVHAHHHLGWERDHWLDVTWLCQRHHTEAHYDRS